VAGCRQSLWSRLVLDRSLVTHKRTIREGLREHGTRNDLLMPDWNTVRDDFPALHQKVHGKPAGHQL
jgi:hypothetical protein